MKIYPIVILGLLIGGLFTSLIFNVDKMHKEKNGDLSKIVTCYIDSTEYITKYEISPELIIKYHTDCGNVFFSYKKHSIGDSVNFKIILIE